MQEEVKFHVKETEHGCCFHKRVVKGTADEPFPEVVAEFVEEADAEAYAEWRNKKED